MLDREKVIGAFERCFCEEHEHCPGCYQDGPGFGVACRDALCMDVLALLKEQEIKPYRFKRVQATYVGMNFETGELNHYDVYECPHCGDEVTKSMAQEWKYCPECGNPVKWE